MQKDYWEWHKVKSILNDRPNSPKFFKPREIWYIACGLNVGREQDGRGQSFRRPVLILRKFSQETFWGIPLTTKEKKYDLFFPLNIKDNKGSWAMIAQLKLFDSKRLIQRIDKIDPMDFSAIKEKIRMLLV